MERRPRRPTVWPHSPQQPGVFFSIRTLSSGLELEESIYWCFVCLVLFQVSAPEYVFLISELAGERRFASAVAQRLESLGALTHGDRRAAETRDLSHFNVYTKYGRAALNAVVRAVRGTGPAKVPPPSEYPADFYAGTATSTPIIQPLVLAIFGRNRRFLHRPL